MLLPERKPPKEVPPSPKATPVAVRSCRAESRKRMPPQQRPEEIELKNKARSSQQRKQSE